MENASKALLMAAGVLLAVIILSAFVMMYGSLSDYQNTQVESTREAQVVEFNNQYTTYDRDNIKGIDMISLMNRVIDYNRRKSTEGTKDEGSTIGYLPMTVKINLDPNGDNSWKDQIYYSSEGSHLFTDSSYEASKTTNTFTKPISEEVNRIEKAYGKASLNNFLTGIGTLFPEEESDEIVERFKYACKQNIQLPTGTLKIENIKWNDIKKGSQIRNDVYKYYEYGQFKKARFDCKKVVNDKNIGRIIEMDFEFSGKVE